MSRAMAKAKLDRNEIKALLAQLPDDDVYAALVCHAMKRGQDGDQGNISGTLQGMVELVMMIACPMNPAFRMQFGGRLRDAADVIIEGRDRSIGATMERVQ